MAVESISVGNPSVSRSGGTVTVSFSVSTSSPNQAYYHRVTVNGSTWKTSSAYGTVSGTYTNTITTDAAGSKSYVFRLLVQWQKGGSFSEYTSVTKTASYSARTYTVSYNKGANGTGTNTSATKTYNVALTLKGAIFTRTGYTQTGWSTSDGGAKAYNLSASYTTNAATTLYPYWTINTYTVSYDKGANGAGTNTTDTKTYGVALTLKDAIFTRQGYTQTGWSTTDGGVKAYNLSASYTTNAAITLYPYWEQSGFNIYQAVNGTTKQITAIYSVKNGVVSQVNNVYKVENSVVIQI